METEGRSGLWGLDSPRWGCVAVCPMHPGKKGQRQWDVLTLQQGPGCRWSGSELSDQATQYNSVQFIWDPVVKTALKPE